MAPDYHFLYVDQALGSDWLFQAARRYWDRFRPVVATSFDLISLAPARRSVAITVLARRDIAPKLVAYVRQRFPRATIDPLVYDVPADLKLTLDGRAEFNQRFGVPE